MIIRMKKYRKYYLVPLLSAVSIIITIMLSSCSGPGFGGFGTNFNQTQTQGIETFTVTRGDIIQEISSTGTVVSSQENTYNLEVSGEVLSTIEEGEKFSKGDILVKVDDSEGQDNIEMLNIELESAKNSLQSASNSLKNAKINYQSALDSNHIAIQQAELNTKQSEINIKSAIDSLENANRSADIAVENAELALEKIEDMEEYITTDKEEEQSEYEEKSAELNLESAENSAGSSVSQAQNSYDKALLDQSSTYWSNLSSLQSAQKQIELTALNISESQLKVNEAQTSVELAEKNIQEAIEDLKNYTITAQYDGIVLTNEYKTGQKSTQVSSDGGGITVVKDEYLIEASISENDISKVKEGNDVVITLDAYSDKEFTGVISKIVPVSTIGNNNIISFTIYAEFSDEVNVELYSGITANLTITVSKAEDVLYIPIQAIYKEDGKSYVDVISVQPENMERSGSPEEAVGPGSSAISERSGNPEKTFDSETGQAAKKVEITTGINDYTYIEILSGLIEGDIVVTSRL